jgi:hypothetical protein
MAAIPRAGGRHGKALLIEFEFNLLGATNTPSASAWQRRIANSLGSYQRALDAPAYYFVACMSFIAGFIDAVAGGGGLKV